MYISTECRFATAELCFCKTAICSGFVWTHPVAHWYQCATPQRASAVPTRFSVAQLCCAGTKRLRRVGGAYPEQVRAEVGCVIKIPPRPEINRTPLLRRYQRGGILLYRLRYYIHLFIISFFFYSFYSFGFSMVYNYCLVGGCLGWGVVCFVLVRFLSFFSFILWLLYGVGLWGSGFSLPFISPFLSFFGGCGMVIVWLLYAYCMVIVWLLYVYCLCSYMCRGWSRFR